MYSHDIAKSQRGCHKHRNTRNIEVPAKMGRGKAAGVTPGCSSAFMNIITITAMIKRE
jgi:hypothetical protein